MRAVVPVSETCEEWPELVSLDRHLDGSTNDVQHYREILETGRVRLIERFSNREPIHLIVRDRARLIDGVLLRVWRSSAGTQFGIMSLIAVGGYGRGELHPGSDIDVMLLAGKKSISRSNQEGIEKFLTTLWDIGLEVGHSVRTLKQCVQEAKDDITVATSLMESRLLHGDKALFITMRDKTDAPAIWPSNRFFAAKQEEQTQRHARYHDTSSNLEPNIKGAPGGLRDIQMIDWVAKRHFGTHTLRELVAKDFLTAHEYKTLSIDRDFLWQLRFALHTLTGRREDRLLFDYQAKLAKQFGYQDRSHTLAVEQLMQRYYRTAIRVTRHNEMLLQLFREVILTTDRQPTTRINDDFQIVNNNLDVIDQGLFDRRPNALMEVFLHRQEHPEITGVSARTIRLIRHKRKLINTRFRNDPENHRTFLKILRAPVGVTHELRRMNLYGVLGRYIPAFGRIVGLMQYDLFHAYTVDAHTLFVVGNLRRFALSKYNHEFTYCSQIMQSLPKPEIAYLAGLFHDIAKGRGGDHSVLGAADAEAFCLTIGLNAYDARLVAWLVRNHLILSVTAQKKDINDPLVINDFTALVRDDVHLKYLYVLTVADVRGTNPNMWNSWKAALFETLYRQTRSALDRGLENPIDRDELVEATQKQSVELITDAGIEESEWHKAWSNFDETYFLRHSAEEVAWHTNVLRHHQDQHGPVVAVRGLTESEPGSLMVLAPRAANSFPRVTAVLEQLGLTILDARITNVARDYSLDTYRIMGASQSQHDQEERARRVEDAVRKAFDIKSNPKVTRPASRRIKLFSTRTVIEFSTDPNNLQTIMEITAADQPGLLSRVGQAFVACDVEVTAAKITTVGERAEDVFYITDSHGAPLTDQVCRQLQQKITELLPSAA